MFNTIPKSILVIGLVAIFASCSKQEKVAGTAPIKVNIKTIENSDHIAQLSYSGSIEPDNTAQIGFAVQGIVNTIAVEEGQYVREGQLLAGIDATEYTNALAIANAGLEQAEDMYTRLNGLYEKGSLPAKDYIDIKTKVAQAKANKSINAKRINDSRLYAPMSGIIASKMIERGSTAAPGVPAFVIVKTDQVYARIAVPESEIGLLKKEMEAWVYVPTLGDSVKGKISIINPLADPVSKTFSVKIRITNTSGRLLPGMIANIKINTGKNVNVITVPATAVVRDADELTYLFVSNAEKKAVRKRVTIEGLTGANQLIVKGLNVGDKVIIEGQSRLKDGSAIAF